MELPSSLPEFFKWILGPGGMLIVIGWLTSNFAGRWPWFLVQSKVMKRIIIFLLCTVIGVGASYGLSLCSNLIVDENQVYLAITLAFMVSQTVDLKNLAEADRKAKAMTILPKCNDPKCCP